MKVLLVSIALPPKNDPESLQTAKYVKYLAKTNGVDAVTSKSPTLWMPFDGKLLNYIKDVNQIISLRIIEPKYLSIFINKLLRRFVWPDTRFTFWMQSKKVINQLIEKPDVIYSRAFPLSSIFMAKKLKDYYKIPWVLHLSDPWVESPLFDYNKSKYHQKKEKSSFQNADIISFTSLSTLKIYKKKYPEFIEKYKYFPNVYDDEDIQIENSKQENKIIKLVYTGSLNGSRSLKLLIDAFCELQKTNSQLANNFRIVVAGSVDSYNRGLLEKHSDFIEYVGFLSINDAKDLQRSADILLAVDFDFKHKEEAIFFPSKLLDYFITKKPILAITTSGSTTDSILTELNHSCVYHHDEKAMLDLLENMPEVMKRSYEIPVKYSAKYNVERLTELFNELCIK
jgi:glycosyltransferase involved in cell wall biosynthesis